MGLQNLLDALQILFIFSAVIFCIIGIIYFSVAAMRKNGLAYAERGFRAHNQNQPGFEPGPNVAHRIEDMLADHARRVNISFYFSLILATVGLLLVMFALVGAETQSLNGSLLKLAGGVLVEIVAIAFFLNSLRAQREIGEIMQAERDERQNGEVADLLAQMTDANRRDQLIAQLIMKRSSAAVLRP